MCQSSDAHDPSFTELIIPSDLRSAKAATRAILAGAAANGYDEDERFAIKLALEEAMTNAVKHGNRNDPDRHITIRYAVGPRRMVINVADEGRGFDPSSVPDPTLPERLWLPNGRGIMLMKAYMDEVTYNQKGNEVCLVKAVQR